MGRVNWQDAEKIGNENNVGFFNLANDHDKAIVRFAHKTMDDIDTIAVHNITIDGKQRKISCCRSYDQPKSMCPLCEQESPLSVRVFIQVLVYEQDKEGYYTLPAKQMIWERGKVYLKKMQSLFNRYAVKGTGLIDNVFEIERCGKAKDPKTTYEINYVPNLEDDECPIPKDFKKLDPLGTIVLDKTPEEINEFLDTGKFPVVEKKDEKNDNEDDDLEENNNMPTGRRNRNVEETTAQPEEQPIRRRRI